MVVCRMDEKLIHVSADDQMRRYGVSPHGLTLTAVNNSGSTTPTNFTLATILLLCITSCMNITPFNTRYKPLVDQERI